MPQRSGLTSDFKSMAQAAFNIIFVLSSDRPKEFRPKAERDFRAAPISAESRK